MAQVTKTAYPSGLVASLADGSITNQNNPVGKDSSNTTYAQCYLRMGSSSDSYMTYGFDLSDIPDGATIVSVSCTAKAYISNTNSSRITTRQIQMFSGSTAKGTASTISTSTTAITMSVGTWTLAELRNARIRIYAKRGSSSTTTNYYLRFYGATLTVVYEYEDKRYLIKTGTSQWSEVSKVFEKTSSGIVERSLEAVMTAIQNGKNMRYRGVYEVDENIIQIVGSGNSTNCYATVNGVKYTSKTKLSVPIGTVITVVANGSSRDFYGSVFVDGTEILPSQGTNVTYDYIVTSNTALCLGYYVESSSNYATTNLIFSEVNRNIIGFIIAGTTLACEEGMTWEEFVGSRYNLTVERDTKLIISGNRVAYTYNGTIIAYVSGVTPATVIVEDRTYTVS